MGYKTISKEEAKKEYERYFKTNKVDETQLDENFKEMRSYFVEKYYEIKKNVKLNKNSLSELHELDFNFGLELFEYLGTKKDFTSKYESNYGFWRYLACCVIPDLIADRWDIDKTDHFYSKPTGIYPFQVYWYINLSWQGNNTSTIEILKENQEDQILQLVDRPSTIGVNLMLYRLIMKNLATISPKKRKDIFRYIMMKNTSKLVNMRPELYPGGITSYVDMLFEEVRGE